MVKEMVMACLALCGPANMELNWMYAYYVLYFAIYAGNWE